MQISLRSDRAKVSAIIEHAGGRVDVETSAACDGICASPRNAISVLPIGFPLLARTTGVKRLRHLVLQLNVPELARLLDDPANLDAAFDPRRTIEDSAVASLCRLFVAECEKPAGGASLFGDSLSVALVLRLAELGQIRGHRPAAGLAEWQLRRVTEYLESHFAEDVTLDDLARIVRLSQAHFARAFKRSTGLPPHRWLIDLRCAKAKVLLCRAGMGIANIAVATGFSDQAHFTRAFARCNGITPGAWRRAHCRSPEDDRRWLPPGV